ncbi:MAG: hypothetical protein V1493_03915 [Candidatus Diapherotrites archaeon]
MEKMKAVGIALIIIGLILGIEGTVMFYLSVNLIRPGVDYIAGNLAAISVYEPAADLSEATSTLQVLQISTIAIIVSSLVKTLAGIACILLGYVVLKGKEKIPAK